MARALFMAVVLFWSMPVNAQDSKYKSQQVKTGETVLFDGFCIDYKGMAFLLTAPEAERKKCEIEKKEIKEVDKIELEKQLKELDVEYKKKLEMCAIVSCKQKPDTTPYGWKWVAGGVVVGIVVGVISVFVVQKSN